MLKTKRRKVTGFGVSEIDDIVVTCSCPGCKEERHSEGMSFEMFLEDLREEGWQTGKDSSSRFHLCPEYGLRRTR